TKAGWLAPRGDVEPALVDPLYAPMPMSAHEPPPSALSSTTPPSQPPISNAKRCRKETTNGPGPTCMLGDTRLRSSGRLAFCPSTCPLLSGPQNTCCVSDS